MNRSIWEKTHLNSLDPLKLIFLCLGFFFVGLGFLGVFLPVLPTTVFMLVAAACFARSSPRFYHWLMNHRIFGPPIREWRQHRALSPKTKGTAIGLIITSFGISILFFVQEPILRVGLVLLALCVILFLLRIPSRRITAS